MIVPAIHVSCVSWWSHLALVLQDNATFHSGTCSSLFFKFSSSFLSSNISSGMLIPYQIHVDVKSDCWHLD